MDHGRLGLPHTVYSQPCGHRVQGHHLAPRDACRERDTLVSRRPPKPRLRSGPRAHRKAETEPRRCHSSDAAPPRSSPPAQAPCGPQPPPATRRPCHARGQCSGGDFPSLHHTPAPLRRSPGQPHAARRPREEVRRQQGHVGKRKPRRGGRLTQRRARRTGSGLQGRLRRARLF